MNHPGIKTDPVITKLLDKVPADMRGSFSDAQLLALKIALGGRTCCCCWAPKCPVPGGTRPFA